MQIKEIKLWENDTPLLNEGDPTPTMLYYEPEVRRGKGALVIFAGGGYSHRSRHEGEGYAEYYSEKGIACFVVNYRVAPYAFPAELLDARRAVRYVRANAEAFGIDPGKIAVMGSSAGGHLAALTSTYRGEIEGEGVDEIDRVDPTPNGQILCYAVLDAIGHTGSFMNLLGGKCSKVRSVTPYLLADENTPPCFMWHCQDDAVVCISNMLRYSERLLELGVSQEMHFYPKGSHGIGLVTEERFASHKYMTSWAELLTNWLGLHGFIEN